MKLIVGLGNIGEEYAKTNHNAGFMVVEKVAEILGMKFSSRGCDADYAEKNINGERIILAKPRTYMNESGRSVKSFACKFGFLTNEIVIISDDIDLPKGHIRIRKSGSAGTHNGLKSIINELNTEDFARIRVGIGKNAEHQDLADFVLSKMRIDDNQKFGLERAAEAAVCFAKGESIDKIMTNFNGEASGKK